MSSNFNHQVIILTDEIASKKSIKASTGFSPYYLNTGKQFLDLLESAVNQINDVNNEVAVTTLHEWNESIELATKQILKAQAKQAKYANQHRRELTFNVDDLVMLSTTHFRSSTIISSCFPKFIGHFINSL
jgi:hypothetical protein